MTDAHVHLGRLSGVLADGVALDRAGSASALDRLGDRLGLDGVATALGMLEVVEATMERAVRAVSVEEGADPAEAALVAFGGAGGLHAGALARRLEMASVLVPPHAGVFSALGLLLAPPRSDHASTVLARDIDRVRTTVGVVVDHATRDLQQAVGVAPDQIETAIDMRYVGQAHETAVPFRSGDTWETLCSRFHRVHRERNGFDRPEDPVEAVTVRAAAIGRAALAWDRLPSHRPHGEMRRGDRSVVTSGGPVEVPVWRRAGMRPGTEVLGPCIVEDAEATTWLQDGDRGVLHESGTLEVTW